jgi:hypothetical protein
MGAGRAHRGGLFRKAARRRLDAASERALRRRRPFGRSNEPVEHADDRANLIALTRQRLFRREQRPRQRIRCARHASDARDKLIHLRGRFLQTLDLFFDFGEDRRGAFDG